MKMAFRLFTILPDYQFCMFSSVEKSGTDCRKQMKKLFNCLILAVFLSPDTVSAQQLSHMRLDNNNLSDCASFRKKHLKLHSNTIFLEVEIKIWKPIGYCGCKSKLMAYTIYKMSGGSSNALKSGNIICRRSRKDRQRASLSHISI